MREVLADIDRWRSQGDAIALATVIQTWGSAPRGIGAKMALTKDGRIAGSVSGGCVEGAVVEAGAEVLKTGRAQLLHFGVADETAWSVGLACGGSIEVFVKPLDVNLYNVVQQTLIEDQLAATVTVVRGPADLVGREMIVRDDGSHVGSLSSELDEPVLAAARAAMAEERSQRLTLPDRAMEPIEVFIDVLPSAPTLIMVGGVQIAIALAAIAKMLGYRTIVIDPRRAFSSEARFPQVDRLIQAWPDEALQQVSLTRSTAVVMLTHDPKIDDPALKIVLASHVFYIGALGSRKTQAQRQQRLQQAGLSQAQLDRVIGPVGLEIGAKSPEEIALAVMAQIVAVHHGTAPLGCENRMPVIDDLLASVATDSDIPARDVLVGLYWTAVRGLKVGLAATPTDITCELAEDVKDVGQLHARSVGELAQDLRAKHPLEVAIGMAALNALIEVNAADSVEINAREIILERGRGKNVATVGHFPFTAALRDVAAHTWVLELNPTGDDVPTERAPELIPQADVIGLTASTLLNGTFESLAKLFPPQALVVMLGPSTPLSTVLFDYGITLLAGSLVTDPDTVLHYIGQGSPLHKPPGVKRITLMRP